MTEVLICGRVNTAPTLPFTDALAYKLPLTQHNGPQEAAQVSLSPLFQRLLQI